MILLKKEINVNEKLGWLFTCTTTNGMEATTMQKETENAKSAVSCPCVVKNSKFNCDTDYRVSHNYCVK